MSRHVFPVALAALLVSGAGSLSAAPLTPAQLQVLYDDIFQARAPGYAVDGLINTPELLENDVLGFDASETATAIVQLNNLIDLPSPGATAITQFQRADVESGPGRMAMYLRDASGGSAAFTEQLTVLPPVPGLLPTLNTIRFNYSLSGILSDDAGLFFNSQLRELGPGSSGFPTGNLVSFFPDAGFIGEVLVGDEGISINATDGTTTPLTTSVNGDLVVDVNVSGGGAFIYQLFAEGGTTRGQSSIVDFGSTLELTGLEFLDTSGNQLDDFGLENSNGVDFVALAERNALTPVPLPAPALLLLGGLAALGLARRVRA